MENLYLRPQLTFQVPQCRIVHDCRIAHRLSPPMRDVGMVKIEEFFGRLGVVGKQRGCRLGYSGACRMYPP